MLDVARLLTMNTGVLKDLSLEEVLNVHPLIDPTALPFQKVQKTKAIKVKAISSILNDDSVMAKMVIATLEGHETIKANSFVCWGVDNDIWQQSEKNLHAKYTLKHYDADGWLHCEPKEDVPVNACQIVRDLVPVGPFGGFSIINPTWGDERVIENRQVYLHYGITNDYVLQGLDGPADFYRVARKFFDNTYDYVK
jgi:hypothetical protein